MAHLPVLLKETILGLGLKKKSVVIDATADGGGHAEELLKKIGSAGKLFLLDWDPWMISILQQKFGQDRRVQILNLNFLDLRKLKGTRPDAIFFDLGLSSLQLEASGRGFSFQKDEPLLMTFNPETRPTATEFINRASEKTLADLIWKYGEESGARKIAAAIVRARRIKRIETSGELAVLIEKTIPRQGRLHPATKTFQALRIYLNSELENLKEGLKGGWEILKPGGRLAVISFHSLEDRIVKHFSKGRLIKPAGEEIRTNPRARSAKLRIFEKNVK